MADFYPHFLHLSHIFFVTIKKPVFYLFTFFPSQIDIVFSLNRCILYLQCNVVHILQKKIKVVLTTHWVHCCHHLLIFYLWLAAAQCTGIMIKAKFFLVSNFTWYCLNAFLLDCIGIGSNYWMVYQRSMTMMSVTRENLALLGNWE